MILNDCFESAEEKFFEMTDFLKDRESQNLDLSALENFLQREGRELSRRLLTAHLKDRGVGDVGPGVVGADGIRRSHKRIGIRKLKTLFGEIKIRRVGYSARKVSSLFPLDGMLNLPTTDVSYDLQKHLVLETVRSSFDESAESVERWTGVRIAKGRIRNIIIDAARDFEAFYSPRNVREGDAEQAPPLVILTSDGKGIFMRHEDLREATKKRAGRDRDDRKNGKFAKGRKANSKRMATVASVYETDRFVRKPGDVGREFFSKPDSLKRTDRPSPKAKRVWASLEKAGEETIREVFDEALRRDPLNEREWVVLVDGDHSQIRKFKKFSRMFGVSLTIVCDIIHVLKYVWKAGKALNDEKTLCRWVSGKSHQILEGKSSLAASAMRRSATNRKLGKTARKPVDACAKYLLSHSAHLRYDEYLGKGYPIATGVIEGACRHLVSDRMEITGARWGLKGADALLKLRSVKISGDFPSYWRFHEQKQYERHYESLYLNPSILEIGGQFSSF